MMSPGLMPALSAAEPGADGADRGRVPELVGALHGDAQQALLEVLALVSGAAGRR